MCGAREENSRGQKGAAEDGLDRKSKLSIIAIRFREVQGSRVAEPEEAYRGWWRVR